MNELAGPFVVIVLSIREGRGFDFLVRPLYIEATLKGNKIESDPALPDANPCVCTELVWETEKKEVRKLRSSHVPLRIDCFTIDANEHREKIGFLLLSLRSAQAITGNQAATLEYKWHKLVSVPSEYRMCHPELALTLTVRDRIYQEEVTAMEMSPSLENPLFGDGTPQTTVIPIIYLEDGFIQIGQNSLKNKKFILSFLIGTANNLDLLLDEEQVFNSRNDKYYLALSILGLTINTKYFTKNLHEPIPLNDKIIFKLLTNVDILKLFLEEYQTVLLNLHNGLKILASAEINLQNFFQNNCLDVMPCRYEQICEFRQKDIDFVERTDSRVPYISTETILEIDNSENLKEKSVSYSVNSSPNSDELNEESINASGDQNQMSQPKVTDHFTKPILAREDAAVQTTPRQCKIRRSSLTLSKNVKASASEVRPFFSESANYRLFCLTVVFRSITWRQNLNIEGFQFKFHHPKAHHALIINCDLETVFSNEVVYLEDVFCRVYFLSSPENIKNLVMLYPPTVSLQNFKDENLVDDFVLFTKLLLQEQEDYCTYFVVLNKVNNKDELLCDLQVDMTLKELSTNFTEDYDPSEYNLDPIILDDWLAMKSVKELDEWKEKQEILFKDNLKVLECEKLELLQAEWNVKRIELETKLQQGMEKCKILSEELSITANELRIKKRTLDEKLLCDPQMRENIEIKVTQMMEDEMNQNIKKIEAEKQKLLEKIEQVQKEKAILEEIIRDKENELEELRKTTLTKEQTTCLLQELRHMEEKFQQAQMEKAFFKDQWRTALKEVHALKSEDQQQIQQDIRRKKEELSQLSLDASDANEDVDNDRNSFEFELEDYLY